MSGEASQKAMTAGSGTPMARRAAINGMTPQEQKGESAPVRLAARIIGASRPDQVSDNARAAGVRLEPDVLKAIDEVVDPVVVRDPSRTQTVRRADLMKRT